MKLALIPPMCLLGEHAKTDYQLLLPQLAAGHKRYTPFFQTLKRHNPEQYYILDNGAAEAYTCSADELMRFAVKLQADEIVIPDLIKDSKGSQQALEGFMHYLDKSQYNKSAFKYMAVAQGETWDEILDHIDWLVTGWHMNLTSIGLPRHLLVTLGSPYARIQLAKDIKDIYHDDLPEIHFLGSNPVWCTELEAAAKEVPWVRGYDTSSPYVYGYAQEFFDDTKVIARQSKYFELPWSQERAEYCAKNVQSMLNWVGE